MNRMVALYVISMGVFAAGAYFALVKQLHMAQLEGYKQGQYWRWLRRNIKSSFFREFIILILTASLAAICYLTKYRIVWIYIYFLIWCGANAYLIIKLKDKTQSKKPLVFTHRAIRLLAANVFFLALWSLLSYIYAENIVTFVLLLAFIRFLLPFNMLLSMTVIYPLEMLVHYRYFRQAQMKISGMKDLKVIGITGSYGKTSTKYFLHTILSEKYNTLMTPESYNTPMGITKVIREKLNKDYDVFICEMGARNIGDIKLLCKLVNPSIGILTSIGPQHLETFKTIENVAKTKYELIQALPYYGTAVFNGDNSYCLNLARKTGIETLIYSIENDDEDVYIRAEDIVSSREGLRFKVRTQDGVDFECRTKLLGKHNVSNMLAAISTALRLGLSPDEIKRGISNIKPVPHRLQILDTNNGVMVIDDAFNSNPVGARDALETIKEFTDGDRIIVTPGMVELGSIEYEENRKFGKIMAQCCDYAILVGVKRSKPIIKGLKQGNFPEDRIIITTSLNEASSKLGSIVKPGDTVLFENDLPDNYDEM
jgi:UDP-N-acetylmuramoyl-tripeptide--D-alanyl-D-alanine ligase